MGDTWITNLRHFLDEDGDIPGGIPPKARNLAEFLGRLVEAITGDTNGPRCRRRPGELLVGDTSPGELTRELTKSAGTARLATINGAISGWEKTKWDRLLVMLGSM
jgi:hypothetical protein